MPGTLLKETEAGMDDMNGYKGDAPHVPDPTGVPLILKA
jgi:hypothetical protein